MPAPNTKIQAMKAPSESIPDDKLKLLQYPLCASPKLDGFRCLVINGIPHTNSMKLFQNKHLNDTFAAYHELNGLDGELLVGEPNDPNAFYNTSGPLRRIDGKPDFKFYVFDKMNIEGNYNDRWVDKMHPNLPDFVEILPQTVLRNPDDVLQYEDNMLKLGYEGAMIRSLDGRYKFGRCTYKEMNIFKRKPFVDIEAVIVGIEEAYENLNEAHTNELGRSVRSSCKDNLVPKNTLGAFWCYNPLWKEPFKASPGKGMTDAMKKWIWENRVGIINSREVVTVKYQKHGSRENPRIASVIKFRPEFDR